MAPMTVKKSSVFRLLLKKYKCYDSVKVLFSVFSLFAEKSNVYVAYKTNATFRSKIISQDF